MISIDEKKLIHEIQGNIGINKRPFKSIAEKFGISEDELIKKIIHIKEKRVMRRFGAVLRHQKAGIDVNAMVVWKAKESDIENAGNIMAKFPQVSHCYQRDVQSGWTYNLYTMIHRSTKRECMDTVRKISEETGIKNYKILFSLREFKKTSMEYYK